MASIIYKTQHIFFGMIHLSDQVLSWCYQCHKKKVCKFLNNKNKENSRVIQNTSLSKLFLKEIIIELYFQIQLLRN